MNADQTTPELYPLPPIDAPLSRLQSAIVESFLRPMMDSDRKTDSKDAEAFAALIEDIARTPWQTLPMPEPVPIDYADTNDEDPVIHTLFRARILDCLGDLENLFDIQTDLDAAPADHVRFRTIYQSVYDLQTKHQEARSSAAQNAAVIDALAQTFGFDRSKPITEELCIAILKRAQELQRAYSDQQTTATATPGYSAAIAKQELEAAKELYPYEAFRTSGIMNVPRGKRNRLGSYLELKYGSATHARDIMRQLTLNGTEYALISKVAERILEIANTYGVIAPVLVELCNEYGALADQEEGVKETRAPL